MQMSIKIPTLRLQIQSRYQIEIVERNPARWRTQLFSRSRSNKVVVFCSGTDLISVHSLSLVLVGQGGGSVAE